MSEPFGLPLWPFAHGGPCIKGQLKAEPEDFFVDEQLGFEPSGSGDFVWLQIEKRGANTDWVAGKIVELAKVKPHEVSYAGKKDRHALTRQWFSVAIQAKLEPDWYDLEDAEIKILQISRDEEKLRPGDHQANKFLIRLRNIDGDIDGCIKRLQLIAKMGFPNYFGEQRFGRNNANLSKAQLWFKQDLNPKRSERGMLLSAARSYLFNQVLARRVDMGNWNQPLTGDLMITEDSGHSFPIFKLTDEIIKKCQSMEITPSGPLYGAGEPKASRNAGSLETDVLKQAVMWIKGLEMQRMRAGRRELRAKGDGLEWEIDGDDLIMDFQLATGCFATSLLREIRLVDV